MTLDRNVTDYHTQSFKMPAGLFRNALKDDPDHRAKLNERKLNPPPLSVRVTCDKQTLTQYIGMAKYDLFLRLDRTEASALWFSINFLKAAFGLWLLIGLSVVNRQGEALGTVVGLLENGQQGVLRVQPPTEHDPAAEERLIPFVAAIVDDVDLATRRIVADWGLDY